MLNSKTTSFFEYDVIFMRHLDTVSLLDVQHLKGLVWR